MKTNIYKKFNNNTKAKLKARKIAIIKARFNQAITSSLEKGAIEALAESGIQKKNIEIVEVPGSFEIPLAAKRLALKKSYSGIVAIGAIIKGETAHFDYIAKATADGILKIMLEYNIPISFGVITTYNLAQAKKRSNNDEHNKGREAALALIEILTNESI